MLSIKEIKEYIGNPNLTDKQAEIIRDGLYLHISDLVENYFVRSDN